MKLSCPACNARYTTATERLGGRRVKVRYPRCGESFPVEPQHASGEVYATHLTGERNESSVLFSLATLAKPTPPSPKVTESSTLIDLRALVSESAHAPLFAPPVTFAPAESEEQTRPSKHLIVAPALALAFVAMVGVTSFVVVRSRPTTTAAATPATPATPTGAAPAIAIVADPAPRAPAAHEPGEPTPATSAVAVATPARPANAPPPARSAARASDARPSEAASTPGTPQSAVRVSPRSRARCASPQARHAVASPTHVAAGLRSPRRGADTPERASRSAIEERPSPRSRAARSRWGRPSPSSDGDHVFGELAAEPR